MQEQRAHTRKLMRAEAVLADAGNAARHPVVLLDISRLGVSFSSPAPLESGSRHILDFNLPGMPRLHETVVQVVHTSEAAASDAFRVGARFVHIAPETSDSIVQFVAQDAPG
jgi:hypothetical protein